MNAPVADRRIREAARWLASLSPSEKPHPIVPVLCQRFALSAVDAVVAIREANLIHGRAT